MASLDDTPMLEKGTSLRVGSWIFVADGSGGFKSCSIEYLEPCSWNLNQWTLNPAELEQDQAFIKYLEELDEPIPEDELAEWSHDIDLFMEGLNNPDKLEALWEQSKAKKTVG